MKNPFRVKLTDLTKDLSVDWRGVISDRNQTAERIFEDLDKIIISGYPYKKIHPRKYNMLKKKYL